MATGQSRLSISCRHRFLLGFLFLSIHGVQDGFVTWLSHEDQIAHMVGLLHGDAKLPLVQVRDKDPISASIMKAVMPRANAGSRYELICA